MKIKAILAGILLAVFLNACTAQIPGGQTLALKPAS